MQKSYSAVCQANPHLYSSTPLIIHVLNLIKAIQKARSLGDRLKAFVPSLHEHTYFPINKKQAERRLTPICNLQRGAGGHLSNLDKEKQQVHCFLMPCMSTEPKQQSWKTLRRIRGQNTTKLTLGILEEIPFECYQAIKTI